MRNSTLPGLAKPKVKQKSLQQQSDDFTNEGAPPPGKVDTRPPATSVPGAKKKLSASIAGSVQALASPPT